MADLRIETPHALVRLLILTRSARRNALSLDLITAVEAEIGKAEKDGMRALVITGEGPAFSAGADFSDLTGDASDVAFDARMFSLTSRLAESPLVSFAAISGPCIGAGFDLAMACDFRLAAPDATFSLPPVRLGILYNPERLAQLVRMLGEATAKRMLLLGETLDQAQALTSGIATHGADQDVRAAAIDLAIRASGLPASAQKAAKDIIRAMRDPGFSSVDWQDRRRELLGSEERREAFRAIRKPKS
jgi:enoyl-CoA hydratase/carnithine racemase